MVRGDHKMSNPNFVSNLNLVRTGLAHLQHLVEEVLVHKRQENLFKLVALFEQDQAEVEVGAEVARQYHSYCADIDKTSDVVEKHLEVILTWLSRVMEGLEAGSVTNEIDIDIAEEVKNTVEYIHKYEALLEEIHAWYGVHESMFDAWYTRTKRGKTQAQRIKKYLLHKAWSFKSITWSFFR
jgi:hypothetical protein